MADSQTPSTPTPAQAPQSSEGQTKETKNLQSTSAPASTGSSKSNPVQAAANEVLNTLPNQSAESEVSDDEIEDDGSDLELEAKKAEARAEKLRKKLKVGGKEIEVDEDELVKRAQMGFSAEEKWQEAAKMRKQVESFINMLQQDPATALEKMGFDVDALAEARIRQRIEEMQKSPEQLELERIRRENEQIKAERERERQQLQQAEMQRMQEQFAVQIDNEITEALDSPEFGLPKNPYFVKRIADVMIYGLKNGKDISAKRAAEIVRDEVQTEWREMFQVAPDETFEKLIGKDRLNKYRRAKIKTKAKAPVTTAEIKPTGTKEIKQAQSNQTEKAKMRARDFFKNLGSK